METIVYFAFALILGTMVASNSYRISLICDELDMMSERLDNITTRLEKIEKKVGK